jgi:hypothetical protein
VSNDTKIAQNRAAGLLEDLKRSKGHLYDALFWCEKLDKTHMDHSYFDHAVSVAALKSVQDQQEILAAIAEKLTHLKSKGLK